MLSRAANLHVGAIGTHRIASADWALFGRYVRAFSCFVLVSSNSPTLAALGPRLRGLSNNVAAKILRQKSPTPNARPTAIRSRTASFKSGARELNFPKSAVIGGPACFCANSPQREFMTLSATGCRLPAWRITPGDDLKWPHSGAFMSISTLLRPVVSGFRFAKRSQRSRGSLSKSAIGWTWNDYSGGGGPQQGRAPRGGPKKAIL